MSCGIDIAVIWEVLFAYDAIIFVLTLLRTYNTRPRERVLEQSNDVTYLLLRDGEPSKKPLH